MINRSTIVYLDYYLLKSTIQKLKEIDFIILVKGKHIGYIKNDQIKSIHLSFLI